MAYRLPGTRIEEVVRSLTPSVGLTQRIPCFIGTASATIKVAYEQVIRTSTGATPLADSLVYSSSGIAAVTFVGSQRGLKDYVEGTHYTLSGNKILWTSSGVVLNGATYYVSYTYNRALTDYGVYKEFISYEDLIDDLGDDIPANTLVMIGKLALKYYGLPKIGVVQVVADTDSEYINCLDAIKYRDIQTVGILNSSSAVRTAGISHVVERSLPDNKRFRMYYTGAPVGTPLGSVDDFNSICGMSYAIQQERVVFMNVPRALYYYTDPVTYEEKSTVVDGAFIGAAVGAYRDSFLDPTTTLMNKNVPGIYLFPEDFDTYYSDRRLAEAGGASCFLMQHRAGLLKVIDDLTTDNAAVERNNINIITAKDFIAKDLITQIDRAFKGSLIKNRDQFKSTVFGYISSLMSSYLANGYIENIVSIVVELPESHRDTVEFYYSYNAIYTAKYFDGKFSIEI